MKTKPEMASAAYLLIAVTVLLPLANSRQFYWPATTPKALLVQTAATLLALLFVKHLAAGRELSVPEYPALPLVLALLALAIASTVTAAHKATAVYGLPGSSQGLLTMLSYGALFFGGCVILRRRHYRDMWLLSVVVVTLLVAGWSFFDHALRGFDPNAINYGPIYNRTLLAAFLVLMMPLCAAKLTSTRWRYPALAALIAGSGVLALSYTRAAWIALFAAWTIFGLVFAARPNSNSGGRRSLALIIACLFFAGLFFFAAFGRTHDLRQRVETAAALNAGNWAMRMEMWRAAAASIRDRPWLGAGPDNIAFTIAGAAGPTLVSLEKGSYADDLKLKDVHNHLVQTAAGLGVPAALFYVAIWFYLIGASAQKTLRAKDEEEAVLLAGTGASLTGGFIVLLLTPSNIVISPYVWLVMGLAVALLASTEKRVTAPRKLRLILPALAMIAAAGGVSFLVIRPAVADHFLSRSFDEDYYADLRAATTARDLAPEVDTAHRQIAEINRRLFELSGDPGFLSAARISAQSAVDRNPVNPYNYFYLGSLLEFAYLKGGTDTRADALAAYQKATVVFPLYPEAKEAIARLGDTLLNSKPPVN